MQEIFKDSNKEINKTGKEFIRSHIIQQNQTLHSSLANLAIKHLPFKNCEINYVLFFQCHIFTTTSISFHGERNHLKLEAYFEWCRTVTQHQWFPLKKFQSTNRHPQDVCLIRAKTYTLINDYPKEQIAAPR